jgi:hypothetical protein
MMLTLQELPPPLRELLKQPLKLRIKGVHVPSFKNSKRAILDRRSGKMRTLTKKETRALMDQITLDFVSQSVSCIQTAAGETLTAPLLRSSIALLMPQDDSRAWIPEHHVYSADVDKGFEGAEITIERLDL